jgi:DNA-binding MurR/RpiR family transcriptional regulator
MIDEETIRRQYEMLRPALDERARRLFAASHVQMLGRGGIAAVARATGIAPSTIGRGLKELDQGGRWTSGSGGRAAVASGWPTPIPRW